MQGPHSPIARSAQNAYCHTNTVQLLAHAPMVMAPQAYTIREFCARYAIGRTKAYDEIGAGRLAAVKVGRRTLIGRADAEAWFCALPKATHFDVASTEPRKLTNESK